MDLNFKLTIKLGILLILTMSNFIEQVNSLKKICGDALNEVLDNICANGFSKKVKRDLKVPHITENVLPIKIADLTDRNQVLLKVLVQNAQGSRDVYGKEGHLRRYRRRIAHECCKNGCTYDDIVAYCL